MFFNENFSDFCEKIYTSFSIKSNSYSITKTVAPFFLKRLGDNIETKALFHLWLSCGLDRSSQAQGTAKLETTCGASIEQSTESEARISQSRSCVMTRTATCLLTDGCSQVEGAFQGAIERWGAGWAEQEQDDDYEWRTSCGATNTGGGEKGD